MTNELLDHDDVSNTTFTATYEGTYTDLRGSEPIAMKNDGETLTTVIRGVIFSGPDFDALSPCPEATTVQLSFFTLSGGDLCSCTFSLEMSLPMNVHDNETEAILRMQLNLGEPSLRGGIDSETLELDLTYDDVNVTSAGKSGWFEDELLNLQSQLPESDYLKTCINCQYSDYRVGGSGLFSSMMCFRNIKREYLAVKSKNDYIPLQGRHDRWVQETYYCPEFSRRKPGTGYRG